MKGEMKPTAANLLKAQPTLPNLFFTHQKLNLIAELTRSIETNEAMVVSKEVNESTQL